MSENSKSAIAEQQEPKPETPPWNVISWRDFLTKETTTDGWLVDGLLPWNGLSLLVGPPKSGKSSLGRVLGASLSGRRNKFLGRNVEHCSVLHISLEERMETMRRHYEQLQPDPDRLFVLENPHDRPQDQFTWLDNILNEGWSIGTVIIDTVLRFTQTQDSNDYSMVTSDLDILIELARRYTVNFLLIHHSKKGTTSFGSEALGSTALPASCDTFLELKVNSAGDRIIHGYGRDDVHLPDTPVHLHHNGWVTDDPVPDTPDDLMPDSHTAPPPLKGGAQGADVINLDQNRR